MDNIKVITLLTELRDYYIKHENIWDKTKPIEDTIHIYRSLDCNIDKIQAVIDTLKEEVRKSNAKALGKSNLYKGVMDLIAISGTSSKCDTMNGVFEAEGKDCVMCNCMIYAFDKGVLPNDIPICKMPTYTNALSRWINPVKNIAIKNKVKVNIPNIKTLKSEKKLNKEIITDKKNLKTVVVKTDDNNYIGFNVDYLIIAREILGDTAEFFKGDKTSDPVYCKSDIGEGLVFPVQLNTYADFTKIIIPRI